MIWLGVPLTLLAGASLGAFGAGGSILMVPILVYALGFPAQDAVAMSLLVIGATSVAALLSHGHMKRVHWRAGIPFGAAAMMGAYAGGRVAAGVPGPLLLAGFALLMIAAAWAMLRTRGIAVRADQQRSGTMKVGLAMVQGGTVGLVAGLVGAGGGFLVVPAFVLFGGLPMRSAIATSLLVVAMQSVAGVLGHASHLDIDWTLAAALTALAVAGSVAGSRLSAKLPAERLRRGFAWFVAVIGASMLVMQMPESWTVAASTWLPSLAPLLGGALIGLAAALLWMLNGRIAGVSGIAGGLLRLGRGDQLWRALFVAGLAGGGLLMRNLYPSAFESGTATTGTILLAGFLVGVGTTLANGCTSGHGVCGVARLSPRSLVAVASFMGTGMLTVYVVRHAWKAMP